MDAVRVQVRGTPTTGTLAAQCGVFGSAEVSSDSGCIRHAVVTRDIAVREDVLTSTSDLDHFVSGLDMKIVVVPTDSTPYLGVISGMITEVPTRGWMNVASLSGCPHAVVGPSERNLRWHSHRLSTSRSLWLKRSPHVRLQSLVVSSPRTGTNWWCLEFGGLRIRRVPSLTTTVCRLRAG